MKPGTQADLRRELLNEHGINCTPAGISKLVTTKDYRIVKTRGGKIKIAETIKRLIDSDFGRRTKPLENESVEPEPNTTKTKPVNGESEEETGQDKIPTLNKSNRVIAFQKGRKTKAEADKLEKESVLLSDVVEKIYDTLRPLRDDIQLLHKKIGHLTHSAKTPHESMQIIQKETDRILLSRIGGDYIFDSELKKKIKKILMM